jgi:hypothetical protein
MSVIRFGHDTMDEYTINWYEIDSETYGVTSDGKILDSDGVPVSGFVDCLNVLQQVAKYEASK